MPPPIKVLFLVNTLRLGGTERNVALLCRHFDRNRFVPEVWVLHEGGELEESVRQEGIEVRSLNRKWAYSPLFAFRVARQIARTDANLVHAFLPTVAAYVGLSKTVCGLKQPAVLSMGQSYLTSLHRRVIGCFNACFDEVIVNSPSAGRCAASVGFSEHQIHTIPNGHEVSTYQQPVDRLAIRGSLGIAPDEVMLLTVGRLIDTKRICDAIDATARLADRWPVKLVVVGDGPDLARLKRQVTDLGLESRVVFARQRSDVPQLLEAADIFVFPSESEGLPNALIEASLARRPIVACKVPGVVDVLCDAETALLVPPRNAVALALAIQDLLEDRAKADQLAAAAQHHAATKYTVEQWVQGHYDVYERLLNSRLGNVPVSRSEKVQAVSQ